MVEYKQILSEVKKKSENVFMGLDHNLDFLKSAVHRNTCEFIELNLEQELVPTVTQLTHITKSMATLIDNILVSQKFDGKFESNILIDNISDHLTICLNPKRVVHKQKR